MSELLTTGLEVTVIGMGVVFMLLSLLVWIVHAMSAFCRLLTRTSAEKVPEPVLDEEMIGVISAPRSHNTEMRTRNSMRERKLDEKSEMQWLNHSD